MQPSDQMVLAGARALNKLQAEACNVDADDQWKFYSDEAKEDARKVIAAALTAMPDDLLRKLVAERGCVMVPREPTEAMLQSTFSNDMRTIWGAMLAASDSRQQAQDDGEEGA